jgi:excisionase family DNA binding protein
MLDLREQRTLVDAAIKPGLTFSIVETSQIMGRHVVWVRELLNDGQIKFIKLGRHRVIPRAVLIDILTNGT